MRQPQLRKHPILAAALLCFALAIPRAMAVDESPAKLPVPAAAALDDARKTVSNVFKSDLDRAKKPEEKSALAAKLLALADKGDDQPPGRFALYVTARDLASDAGDFKTAISTIDSIAEQFDVDGLAMKLETLNKSFKSPRASSQRKEVADTAKAIALEAMALDRDDAADEAAGLALRMARLSGDSASIAAAAGVAKNVEEVKSARVKLKADFETLTATPADPAANLAIGKFYCFVKSDWEKGLPMLAIGSDAELKALAEREAKAPTQGDDQVALGDDWWTLAEKSNGTIQRNIRIHAAAWYTEASPKISPFNRAKIEKRVAVLTPAEHAAVIFEPSGPLLRRVLAIRHTDASHQTSVHIKDLSFDITWVGSRWAGCDAAFEFTSVRKLGLTLDAKSFPGDNCSAMALVVFYHSKNNGYLTAPTLLMLNGKADMVRTCKPYTIQPQKLKPGAPPPPPGDGRAGAAGKLNYPASGDLPDDIYHTITRYNGDKNDIANLVTLPDENRFAIDLSKWAPKEWDGGAWIIFNATSPITGTGSFVRGHLDVPGVRLDRR